MCDANTPRQQREDDLEQRVRDLEEALVEVAHGMHKMPQYMLIPDLALIDADRVTMRLRNGRVVKAFSPLSQNELQKGKRNDA